MSKSFINIENCELWEMHLKKCIWGRAHIWTPPIYTMVTPLGGTNTVTPWLYYDWTAMEVHIAYLWVLCLYQMELPEYNNIVMKIMLGETFNFAMCLPYYFSGYSISATQQSRTQALTPGCFQLALVETWPDCFTCSYIYSLCFFFIKYFFI